MSKLPIHWLETPDANGWVPNPDNPVRIVCAANKAKDGTIFCGARHFSNAMFGQMKACGLTKQQVRDTEQGFVDQYDRWWSREQAYEIMKLTGQPMLHEDEWGPQLYSENLY